MIKYLERVRDKCVRVCKWQQAVGYAEVSYSPLKGHKYGVTCVKVSPQSTMLASASIDGTTVLWNLRTGSKIHTMVQPSGECVRVCRFSPDSTFLVTAGDNGQVCLWDLVRRTLIKCFQQHEGAVQGVSFTPDSNWLLTSCTFGVLNLFSVPGIVDSSVINPNGNVNVFSTIDDAHDLGVVCCDFSPQQIVTSNYIKFKLEMASISAKMVAALVEHKRYVGCCAFSRDGSLLASGSNDKSVIIWDLTKSNLTIESNLIRYVNPIRHSSIDGDTTFESLKFFAPMRPLPKVFEGHADAITTLAFTPDSLYIVTACSEGTWRIFDIEGESSSSILVCEAAHDLGVQGCDFSPASAPFTVAGMRQSSTDDQSKFYVLATCGNDSLVKLWQITVLLDQTDEHDNETLEGDSGLGRLTANAISYMEKKVLAGHGGNVMDVRFAAVHGEILGSVATDRTARLWSVNSGVCLHVLENHDSLVTSCAFSNDTSFFATGALDKTVTVWRLPQQLVSQSNLIERLRNNRKKVIDWKTEDVLKWLSEINMTVLESRASVIHLNGRHLLTVPGEIIAARLHIYEDHAG
ncbi:WD repeat, SAM and U-box domain-containing protein 1-like [Fopius arisanus]|uniref:WD repeat, SAM and U-box domain-containing protein 1-like n=1 Tax=Fopius arisanus TaxID=64838 RepID=A0A9R1TCS2_9HYME|nr:PREDICTED: WD repeat, SAM and U-box domain-containing protein 1-like [Fopius arisanus]